MTGEELAQGLLAALGRRKQRHGGDMVLNGDGLERLLRDALNPQPEGGRPAPIPQLPVPPAYPKLKVKRDLKTGKELQRVIVHTIHEEKPYMSGGWYTEPIDTPPPAAEEIKHE